MSVIIVPRRWTRQPTGPVEIDWTHPLTRGLQEALHDTYQFDAARRIPLVSLGVQTAQLTTAKFGFARQHGTQRRIQTVATNKLSDAPLPRTVFLQHQLATNAADARLMWRGQTSGGSTGFSESLGTISASGRYTYDRRVGGVSVGTSSWAATLNIDSRLVVTNDGVTAANTELYENGVLQTRLGTGTAGTAAASLAQVISLGGSGSGAAVANAKISLCLIWTRIQTLAEIKEISRNPWQIFKPISNKIYIDAAAAGGGFLAAWARNRSQVIGAGAH